MEHIRHKWVRRFNVTKRCRCVSKAAVAVTERPRTLRQGGAHGSRTARGVIPSHTAVREWRLPTGVGRARGPGVLFVEHAVAGRQRVREPGGDARADADERHARRARHRVSQGARDRQPRRGDGVHERCRARARRGRCAEDQGPDEQRARRALHGYRPVPLRSAAQGTLMRCLAAPQAAALRDGQHDFVNETLAKNSARGGAAATLRGSCRGRRGRSAAAHPLPA
jgi:hypothetical protein